MGSYTEEEIERMGEYVNLEENEVVDAEILEVEVIPGYKGNGKQFNLSFKGLRGVREGETIVVRYVYPEIVAKWLKNPKDKGGLGLDIPTVTKLINHGEGLSLLDAKPVTLTAKAPNDKGYTKLARITTLKL